MFNQIGADELWVAFGTRSNFRYIPVHDVVAGMDPRICATLPVFHALTGCDTVSAFSGRNDSIPYFSCGRSLRTSPLIRGWSWNQQLFMFLSTSIETSMLSVFSMKIARGQASLDFWV